MKYVENKKQFVVALIQGLGANLVSQSKEIFAEQVLILFFFLALFLNVFIMKSYNYAEILPKNY